MSWARRLDKMKKMIQTFGYCNTHNKYNAECDDCLDAKPILEEALDMKKVIQEVNNWIVNQKSN